MDLLAKAIARSHYARQIPIFPAVKPKPPAPKLVETKPQPKHAIKLPGVAPWREPRPPIAPAPQQISIKKIIAVCAAEFDFTPEQIRGNYRTIKIAFARHVAQYLAQRLTRQSLPIIGRIFFRDHTSVLHAVRKIGRLVETDNAVRQMVERLEAKIRACGSCT